MSDHFDWRIVDRHLAGEASSDDDRALQAWLAGDPHNAGILSAARAAARLSDRRPEPRWDVDRAWSRVSARMNEPRDDSVIPLRRRKPSRWTSWSRARVASSVGVVLVAASVVAIAVQRPLASAPGVMTASRPHEVIAATAQQTRITLGEGTRVVLNAGSRLRYGDDFGRGARDVELDGEGYFDVVHDEMRPFRVHARGSVAEDVGTRFVVRAYPEQTAVDVVVIHGSVVVRGARTTTPPTLLVAGQRGRVTPDGAVTRVHDADVDRWLEWTRGGIVLEGVTLGEAVVDLGRRFGVRIEVVGDELQRRSVSARFHDDPLPRVLDALGAALGARWSRVGDRVVIAGSE